MQLFLLCYFSFQGKIMLENFFLKSFCCKIYLIFDIFNEGYDSWSHCINFNILYLFWCNLTFKNRHDINSKLLVSVLICTEWYIYYGKVMCFFYLNIDSGLFRKEKNGRKGGCKSCNFIEQKKKKLNRTPVFDGIFGH